MAATIVDVTFPQFQSIHRGSMLVYDLTLPDGTIRYVYAIDRKWIGNFIANALLEADFLAVYPDAIHVLAIFA